MYTAVLDFWNSKVAPLVRLQRTLYTTAVPLQQVCEINRSVLSDIPAVVDSSSKQASSNSHLRFDCTNLRLRSLLNLLFLLRFSVCYFLAFCAFVNRPTNVHGVPENVEWTDPTDPVASGPLAAAADDDDGVDDSSVIVLPPDPDPTSSSQAPWSTTVISTPRVHASRLSTQALGYVLPSEPQTDAAGLESGQSVGQTQRPWSQRAPYGHFTPAHESTHTYTLLT